MIPLQLAFLDACRSYFSDFFKSDSAACSPIESLFQLLYCLIDRERRRPLARREFLVGLQVLGNEEDTAGHYRSVGHLPVVIGIRRDVSTFIRIGMQIEELRKTEYGKGLGPDLQRPLRSLLHEQTFQVSKPNAKRVAFSMK